MQPNNWRLGPSVALVHLSFGACSGRCRAAAGSRMGAAGSFIRASGENE
jgi:hypothetical protein